MIWQGMAGLPALVASASRLAQANYLLQGYPEYCTSPSDLDPTQRKVLHSASNDIWLSLRSMNPVRAVLVVGHADRALRKPVSQRAAFELEVSLHRAASVKEMLLTELVKRAGCKEARYVVEFRHAGIGSQRLAVAHPVNESQMRKNRRVEIILVRRMLGPPSCDCRA